MKILYTACLCTFLLVTNFNVVADQLVADDQIVDGSLCVGPDCIPDQDFGFDTIQLKTDDPIVKFEDTSTTATYPTNDWSLGITDNAGAGPLQFFINDVTSGATVLLLESGPTGGIALGAGSTLESNAISVGATGAERRIMHVADGVVDTDAATMDQFNAFTATVNSNIAGDKAALDAELLNLQNRIDGLSTRLDAIVNRLAGN